MSDKGQVVDIQELLEITHVKSNDEVNRLICRSSWQFKGQADDLYMAVGALVVGRLFGWRILRLTLDSKQYAKYQRILSQGLDEPGDFHFNEWMRERDRLSYKSVSLAMLDTLGDFWAACKGRIAEFPISKRRDIQA